MCTLWPERDPGWRNRIEVLADSCSSICAGREICPETGQEHIHLVFTLRSPCRLPGVKRFLGDTAHCDPRRGTQAEAEAYCKKGGDVIIDRQGRATQGRRTDITELRVALDEGGLPEAKRRCPDTFLRYASGSVIYMRVQAEVIRPKPHIYIFYTEASRTGKSYTAKWSGNAFVMRQIAGQPMWWDGYAGQPIVVLDEFDKCPLPYGWVLALFDYGPLQLPVKGGHVPCAAHTFVVTCNSMAWYKHMDTTHLDARLAEFGEWHTQNPWPLPSVQNTN